MYRGSLIKPDGGYVEGEKSKRLKMNHKNSDAAHPRYGVRKSDKAGVTTAALPLASERRIGVGRDSHPPLGLLKLGEEPPEPEEGHPTGQLLKGVTRPPAAARKCPASRSFLFPTYLSNPQSGTHLCLPYLTAYIQFLLLALSSKLSGICPLLTISVDRLTHTTICSHLDYLNSFLLVILLEFMSNHY